MDATSKFQQSLPYALLPVSVELSALHCQRPVSASQDSPDFCAKCGFYLLNGQSTSRCIRKPGGMKFRQTQCVHCNHKYETPVSSGNLSLFPSQRQRRRHPTIAPPLTATEEHLVLQPEVVVLPPPSFKSSEPQTTEDRSRNPKSRPKKKSALQDMLARNRKREEQAESATSSSGGLVAFLSSL